MKVIKKLSVCLVLILVASLFFACSPRRQGQTSFTYDELMEKFEGEIERGATIRVLDNKMSLETGFFDEIVDAFNEKYKEYGVTAIDANIDDYTDLKLPDPTVMVPMFYIRQTISLWDTPKAGICCLCRWKN